MSKNQLKDHKSLVSLKNVSYCYIFLEIKFLEFFIRTSMCNIDVWKKLDMCNDIREGVFIFVRIAKFSDRTKLLTP